LRAPVLRADAFLAPAPRLVARFFGAARFLVAARFFVVFLAARFFVAVFFAARFFVAVFFAARFFGAAFLLVLRPADFFGAAALRFLAFFFGAASVEAVGVIMDIMSAIIVASPVWVH
jgi:hypothetical protein